MATINSTQEICTLINVFTVLPEKQQALFELLVEVTEKVMSTFPGYISANLHISDDKKTITNYAQWASLADFKNMMKQEAAQEHMKRAAALAVEFKPVTYSTVWSHSNNHN